METVSEIFVLLDRFLSESVTEGAGRLADEIAGPVTAGAALYILTFGLAVTYGGISMPIQETLKRILVIAFISALALEVGFYQREIVPSILALPDGLADAILPGEVGPVASVVDAALLTVADTVTLLLDKSGFLSSEGLAYAMAAFLFILAAVPLMGIGCYLLVISKAFMAFLLILGPAAIACLMFERTSSYFDGWCRQLANYCILAALVSVVFGGVAGMFNAFVGAIEIGEADISKSLLALLVGSLIGCMLMSRLESLAAGISGGAAIQISRPLSQLAAVARAGFNAASRPLRSIGRHSYQAGANQSMPTQRNLYLRNAHRATVTALPSPALALPAPAGTGAASKASSNVRYQHGSPTGAQGKSPGVRWQMYKPKPPSGKTP